MTLRKVQAVSGVDGNSGEEFYEASTATIPKTRKKVLEKTSTNQYLSRISI